MAYSKEENSSSFNNFSYRRATFVDCDILYNWANDPLTRENAHNKESIPYENHLIWLKKQLASLDNWIFIVLLDSVPVALLRLDKKGSNGFITYSVAPEYRGKGIGKKVIYMLPEIIKRENIQCSQIIAEVYKTNIFSNKIFLSANYKKQEDVILNTFTKVLI